MDGYALFVDEVMRLLSQLVRVIGNLTTGPLNRDGRLPLPEDHTLLIMATTLIEGPFPECPGEKWDLMLFDNQQIRHKVEYDLGWLEQDNALPSDLWNFGKTIWN
jgi:hypothetical protein